MAGPRPYGSEAQVQAGQSVTALRKTIVEPEFGQIKGARQRRGSIQVARAGEGEQGMGADDRDSQPSQDVSSIARNGMRPFSYSHSCDHGDRYPRSSIITRA
jgi:hypothetical protein